MKSVDVTHRDCGMMCSKNSNVWKRTGSDSIHRPDEVQRAKTRLREKKISTPADDCVARPRNKKRVRKGRVLGRLLLNLTKSQATRRRQRYAMALMRALRRETLRDAVSFFRTPLVTPR